MSTSNIIVASAEQIAEHYNQDLGSLHGKTPNGDYCPYGIAGVVSGNKRFADVMISAGTVICPDCATEDELRGDTGSKVFGNSEWDSPAMCMDCGDVLRVRHLVYESHNPELFDELKDSE
jgi:hypothetical protein